jgi:hypothetical protein
MSRQSGIIYNDTFPYSGDNIEAPYTDGIVGGGLNSNFMIGPPNESSAGDKDLLSLQGQMIPGGIKDSSIIYVYCNRIWYPIFAGDF